MFRTLILLNLIQFKTQSENKKTCFFVFINKIKSLTRMQKFICAIVFILIVILTILNMDPENLKLLNPISYCGVCSTI